MRREYLRAVYREGCSHQAGGRHAEAVRAFAAAVEAAPDFADAVQNLGCSLHAIERYGEAADACGRAVRLRPDGGGYYNLGMALLASGKPAEAADALGRCVSLAPGLPKHHRALARALAEDGRRVEAAEALLAAAERHGEDAGLLAQLASLLASLGQHGAAAGAAMLATKLAPAEGGAQGTLASALQRLGQSRAALEPARAAVRLNPSHAPSAVVLSAVLYTLGEHAEALEMARRARRLSPGLADAWANEALALEALGELEEAEAASRQALLIAPDSVEARYNLASLLLASGRMTAEAWQLYDARFGLNDAARRIAGFPRWRGEDLSGKTLLLHCEQGLGDTIQFARYVPLVAARCARVILAVQPQLVRLLAGTPGADAVADATAPLPAYDVFCPLLSLPGVLGTTLDAIPPVLSPLPVTPAPRVGAGLQVGLAWAGSGHFSHDAARSVPLADLAPLAATPGAVFHSLQWPPQPTSGFPAVDRMGAVTDMADTACLIAGLDLVISVDTAVAHLAAAMGKEVWLLSRFTGCWRWLRDRDDSPWYPTLRIYRQDRPNDWVGVVDRVRADLARRAAGKAVTRPSPAAHRTTALDGLTLSPGGPRTVLAMVGQNENGVLHRLCRQFMDVLRPHGLNGHVVDLYAPGWDAELADHLKRGVLFAYGPAGIGARLPHPDGGLLWDRARVPFISVLADSPCIMPANHHVPSGWVANAYLFADWLQVQRRFIRSPQLAATVAMGVVPNPARDAVRWADRPHRMLFIKTGRDPASHQAEWQLLPRRLRAVVADASTAALQAGVGDITGAVLAAAEAHGLWLEGRMELLFGLMQAVDGSVRDQRSTAMVRALRKLPVDIVGRGWNHLHDVGSRARFHPAVPAEALPGLYADTQFLLNTMPNHSQGTHERVLNGFAAGACIVTDENASMRDRFGALPSYHPVDTQSPGLDEQLASLFESKVDYDTGPAAAMVEADFTVEAHMRDVIDLASAVSALPAFAHFASGASPPYS